MRKLLVVLLILFCSLLSGCFFSTQRVDYRFYQSADQIEMIEIVEVIDGTDDRNLIMEPVSVLDKEEHQNIVNQILKAGGNYVLEGAVFELGTYVIRITYNSGAVELIGAWSYRHITEDGQIWPGCYWFDDGQFSSIISQYVEFMDSEVKQRQGDS